MRTKEACWEETKENLFQKPKTSPCRAPRSCEGTPPGTEIGIGEELAGPAMDVETAACSAARATFTALTTAAKAGSGATEAETEEPATGVDTGGSTGTTESIVALVSEESTSDDSGSSEESPKRPADMLLLVWRGVVITGEEKLCKMTASKPQNNNDLKRSASKQAKRTRCPCYAEEAAPSRAKGDDRWTALSRD